MGSFAIAQALQKYSLSQMISSSVLSYAGSDPKSVILSMMILAIFLSMWISNVAAAVICTTSIKPVLEMSRDPAFSKAMLLSIAYASNLGGMTTPISSPQNAIAAATIGQAMNSPMSLFQWMTVSMPLVTVFCVFIWNMVWHAMKPTVQVIPIIPRSRVVLSRVHYIVLIVSLLTIVLWCIEPAINVYVGSMGITALLPVIAFFGTGILTQKEFEHLPWGVLILIGGGMALGTVLVYD